MNSLSLEGIFLDETSVGNERVFSSVKRVKNKLRNKMGLIRYELLGCIYYV